MKSIQTLNNLEFFFNEVDALAVSVGNVVKSATYSVHFNKAIINDRTYAEGTDEYAIGCGECDYYGYVVVAHEGLVFNATQHSATLDQKVVGVMDLEDELLASLKKSITFGSTYTKEDLVKAAEEVATILYKSWDKYCWSLTKDVHPQDEIGFQNCWYHTPKKCMIGGMPSFMPVLESVLKEKGWEVGYACSERVSVDQHMPDGSVRKVNSFKHVGFYWA